MATKTDLDLIHAVRRLDEDALHRLYDRHIRAVYAVAYRVLDDRLDAEEVAQLVFLRIWQKAAQYDPARGAFLTWLLMITRSAAIDHLRARQRREPHSPVISLDDERDGSDTRGMTLAVILNDDERVALVDALARLPAAQREVLELAYFKGMSHSQIAEYLARPLGTVKSQIALGMKRLREQWLNLHQNEVESSQ
jgi:RNA polymerase sigma-70 factor (ECF subfamily)